MKRFASLALALTVTAAYAGTPPDPTEAQYYTIETYTPPPDCIAEVGCIDLLPNNRIAFGTRRGFSCTHCAV